MLLRTEEEELVVGGYEDWLDRVGGVDGEEGDMSRGTGADPDGLMPDDAFDDETGWPDVDWGAGVTVPAAG